jgi:GTPase SAR1 family protein
MKSPFKFLDAYTEEDSEIFFGRDIEIEEFYDRVFETNLILLYGASGTGKTSLIRCGLANKFESTDWHPMYVRREGNIVETLHREIDKIALTKIKGKSIAEKVKSLYLDYFKPIYLIFDQFEELFILGTREEQIEFFEEMKKLLDEGLQCKVVISMREEYIAYLSDYELVIPALFDNRQRIEKMSVLQIQEVITGTMDVFDIKLEPTEAVLDLVVSKLRDPKQGIELSSLQVYLDSVYRKAIETKSKVNGELVFTPELIKKTGKFEDVLSGFLGEQVALIDAELIAKGSKVVGIPKLVLFTLVTEEGTKKTMETETLYEQLAKRKNISAAEIEYCIQRFQDLRIIQEVN